MILNEYNEIIREHFDFSDRKTTKFLRYIEEGGHSSQLLAALANSLYDKIANKVDDIDFGTIPRSRGDITKVDGFNNTVECLKIIRALVTEYKENTEIVDTVITAIDNIKALKPLFIKAFSLNAEFPMTYYNLMVLAIQHSVSFLIAVAIQYIKDPATTSITLALDKVAYNDAKSNMLFEQLYTFNKSYAKGDVDKVLRDSLKSGGKVAEGMEVTGMDDTDAGVNTININVGAGQAGSNIKMKKPPHPECSPFSDEPCKQEDAPAAGSECPDTKEDEPECDATPVMPVNGSCDNKEDESVQEIAISTGAIIFGVTTAASVLILSGAAVKGLRNIVSWFYNTKAKISDALAVQAMLIELNAQKLQNDDDAESNKDKDKVIKKQLKIAEKLRAWSAKLAIRDKEAKKKAKKELDDEKQSMKADDIADKMPSDTIAASDLF